MSDARSRSTMIRLVLAGVVLVGAIALSGCTAKDAPSDSSATKETPAAPEEPSTEQPGYDSYVVNIVDDDSYTEDGITYSIALNLTATNPSQDRAGLYTGSATAKTDSVGGAGGLQLNASAIAESSQLEFTLVEAFDSDYGALAPLTEEGFVYTGSGTIVMSAAGSGTVGGASGAFANTSGQTLEINTKGSVITMKIPISGHTYTFTGTIRGE